MLTLKRLLILKSSLFSLAMAVSLQQTLSCSAENDFNDQQGFKRKLVQAEEIKIPLDDRESVLCERVSEYVQFYDLCSLESVCKKFAETIRNSRQYEALVFDYQDKNGWKNASIPTFKDLFIFLRNFNFNYMVHFSQLWLNNFPFNMSSGWTHPLPLPYYWEKYLSISQRSTINLVFSCAEHLGSVSMNSKSSFYYKSVLGKILSKVSEAADIHADHQTLKSILLQPDKQCLNETKIDALLMLIMMAVNEGGPVNHVTTRRYSNDILSKYEASPRQKSAAQLYLAQMDLMGLGGPINHVAARQDFHDVFDNNVARPQDRAAAQYHLAQMDLFGEGGPVDYAAARQGFTAVLNNNAASPQDRASAQLNLAKMDLLGQGGSIDHVAARQGFTAVLNNNAASLRNSAYAQLNLAQMDLDGEGGPVDYAAARQGFTAVLNNNAADPKFRDEALFRLAHMDLLGRGGPVDFAAARQGFTAVLNNNAAPPQYRAFTRFQLAEMDLFGQGGPIDHVAARQGFNDVLNDNATTPQNRASALGYLVRLVYEG